jgi:hypothetical protein
MTTGVLALLAILAVGFGLMWLGRDVKPSGAREDGGGPAGPDA